MGIQSPLDAARAEYDTAVEVFKQARDRVTAAKREVVRLEGKARTPAQVASSRLSQRRAQVLRSHPALYKIPNKAKRREAIDAVLAKRDAPRVWRFYLDDMTWDAVNSTRVIYRQNRKRFELYRAGLTLASQLLRRQVASGVGPVLSAALSDNARTIDLHLQALVDASPRQVSIHYPHEWRVISAALRPEGSSPRSKGAQRLLALYQHIVRTHTVED